MIDRIPKKVVSVIIQVCTGSKLSIYSNLRQPNFWFTYSVNIRLHLDLYCRYMDFDKENFAKENKKSIIAFKALTEY